MQIFELQDPLHAMAEANLNGAALFDVAGKSKDPERELSAGSGARQGHRGDGPAGQARRRDLPRQDPGVRGPASSAAFRCVQAWLLEKPAVWAEADAASLAAALMVQRPPARAREDALLQAERLHHRLRIAGLCGELRDLRRQLERRWAI